MFCGSPCEGPLSLEEHPLEGPWTARSILSRVQISWIWPLLRAGLSRPLDEDDVWRVPSRLSARTIGGHAEELWRQECKAAGGRDTEPRLLMPVLVAVARCSLALYFSFSMSCVVYYCFAPIFLRMFLQDLERGAERLGMLLHGAGFAACYFAVSICVCVSKWYAQVAGTQLRLAVQRLVYNACLLMPVDGAAGVSNPMNLMSVDAERFFLLVNVTMPHMFAMLCVFPVLLVFQLGVAPAAACMASTIFTTLLQKRIARKIALSRQRSMRASDRRLTLTEQFLDGIRILKMTAWTDHVAERLASVRDAELAITRRVLIWKGVNLIVGLASPALAGFWMFSTYALLGGQMTADAIFPALTVLKAMQVFMGNMPTAFSHIAEFLTALARVKAFLLRHPPGDSWRAEERHCKPGVPAVSLQQAAWSRCDEPSAGASQDRACTARTFSVGPVSLNLQLGDLCVICGPVGSGKSTLLLGMLRELASRQGRVEVRGSAALCGQEPWIRTATVRDNVRCLRPEDPEAYSQAVEAAQLAQDLRGLPAGDETEIGAQGINLSGGQKARIALARAIFGVEKSDVIFLDDVLSAVDGHVAQCIIRDVILAQCKFKGRTCALVANTFLPLILPHADSVVVLAEGGRVEAAGHPKNAMLESQWLRQVVEAMGGCEIDEERYEVNCVRDSRCDGTASGPDMVLQQRSKEGSGPHQLSVDVMQRRKAADGSLHVAEERRVGVMDLGAYAAYFRQVTPGQSLSAGMATFAVVVALIALAEACRTSTELWVMFWVQRASRGGENGKDFWIGIYSSLLVALICVSGAQVAIFTWAVAAIGRQTHGRMLSKVLGASVPLYFDVTPLGRILNRFSKDLDALDLQLPEMMSEFFQGLAYVLATAAIFVSASYWLIAVLIPLLIVFVRIRRFYSATSRELKRLEAITRSPLYVHFSETMAGRVHIRAFSLMQQMLEEFETRVDRNARIFVHQYALVPWLMYRVNMLASTLVAGVMVIASFLAGPDDSALIGLSLASGAGLIGKLHGTVTFSIETENHFTSVERLEQFQRAPQEQAEPRGRPSILAGWPEHGEVAFEDVRMRYRPGLPLVLDGVSFRVSPGQRAGIIGRTGSGKSSCMLVLLRLVEPCGGRVLVDGVDVSEVPLPVLRGQAMAIIPQDPYLFAGSVHENLDPRRAASPEAVWRALEEAQLADTVRAAGGLEAEVQGKGTNFSAGQRQLLCIARALLRRSRVVLLDEATANIDAATDLLIQRTIRAGFCGSTALIIAHRLSTISDVDVVICLEGGKLAEAGPLGELRCAGGHVAKMFDDAGDMALESAERSPGLAMVPPGPAASPSSGPVGRSGIELATVGHAQSCVPAGCVYDSGQRCTVQ